nr:Rab family GTPase [Candidatus Sigynarchaeota archaeon]
MVEIKNKVEPIGKDKKIVLIGPMAAGKTTFKRVFFEDANPLQLVNCSIEPTRGIENKAYRYFSQTIAVWDLAGQELDNWLGERSDVFQESTVIVCMLSASLSLKDNLLFLIKFLKKKMEIAPESVLFILLNKCDLLNDVESYNMILSIEQYVQAKHPEFSGFCKRTDIYRTSIMDTYFMRTLTVAYKIIEICMEKSAFQVTPEQIKEIRVKMKVLLAFSMKEWYTIADIASKIKGKTPEIQGYLEELHARGYLLKQKESFFSISEKGQHFALAYKKQAAIARTKKMMESIGFFLTLNEGMEKLG